MIIECISDRIKPNEYNKKLVEWAKNSDLEITVNKTYVVLAITKYFDSFFFFILGDERSAYPLAFPEELFLIADNKISIYWDLNMKEVKSLSELDMKNNEVISFHEWAMKGDLFYENLLEQNEYELRVFDSYKAKMLDEFKID